MPRRLSGENSDIPPPVGFSLVKVLRPAIWILRKGLGRIEMRKSLMMGDFDLLGVVMLDVGCVGYLDLGI